VLHAVTHHTRPINSDNLPHCLFCVFAALNFPQNKQCGKFPVMGDVRLQKII